MAGRGPVLEDGERGTARSFPPTMSKHSVSMSRSSSATTIVQNGDAAPPWTPQHVHKPSLLQRTTMNESRRTASISKAVHEGAALDPDELFTKHTISEVKAIQTRLRYASPPARPTCLGLMRTSPAALMRTRSRRSYGSWLGACVISLCHLIIDPEPESAENGTATFCRRLHPSSPSRSRQSASCKT